MRHIIKEGTQLEKEGVKASQDCIDGYWIDGSYSNFTYERSRLKKLETVLVNEQSDSEWNSYCCYCMRKLYLKPSGAHTQNVTLEHIVPNNVTEEHWKKYEQDYLRFTCLDSNHITICFHGKMPDIMRETKITGLPHPHFVSYFNIAASCDGKTLEKRCSIVKSHCCNNNRESNFVMPLFMDEYLSRELNYMSDGSLDYGDDIDDKWFDRSHLGLSSDWFCLLRRLWFQVSQSEYTAHDIESAISNEELRQEIIDDVDSKNEIGIWNKNTPIWILFSEYSWFYDYYKSKAQKSTDK